MHFVQSGVNRTGRVIRRQIPLMLDLALTVHEAQGLTLNSAVVDLGCARYAYTGGLMYPAVSIVRQRNKLWFIGVPTDDCESLKLFLSCSYTQKEMNACQVESESLLFRSRQLLPHVLRMIRGEIEAVLHKFVDEGQ